MATAKLQVCKVCESSHRAYFEEALYKGTESFRELSKVAHQFGEDISKDALQRHKLNHMANQFAEKLDALKKALAKEAEAAPPTVATLYHLLIRQVDGLETMRPNADGIVRAAKAIAEITGMRQQQQMLLAFMDARFSEKELPPATTVVEQLPAPQEAAVVILDFDEYN